MLPCSSSSTLILLISIVPVVHAAFHIPTTAINPTITTTSSSSLYGIDFDAIGNSDNGIAGEECDFVDGDLSQIDLSKCLPFPSPAIQEAEEVVTICMEGLTNNNDPMVNAGLEICYNFSSDRCRAANGGSLETFIQFAGNPVFRQLINAREWKVISIGPIIDGTPTRGAMKTILISVKPEETKFNDRQFLWTIQKERRPPRQGCWLVHECIAVENAFVMTL